MSFKQFIQNYTAYNEWANHQIADWLLLQNPLTLITQVESSYTSIDYTVQHILRAQKFWTLFIQNENTHNFEWLVYEDAAIEMIHEWKAQSSNMRETIEKFNEFELMQQLTLNMPWAKNKRSRYDYIVHVINHSTYHRGQISSIARQLGVNKGIPATDYNIFNCM